MPTEEAQIKLPKLINKTHQHCRRCVCFESCFFLVAHARVDQYHVTCSHFSPSVVVHSACVHRPPRRPRPSCHGVLRRSLDAMLLVQEVGIVHSRRLSALVDTRTMGHRRHRPALRYLQGCRSPATWPIPASSIEGASLSG